jgi:hypothetical protein
VRPRPGGEVGDGSPPAITISYSSLITVGVDIDSLHSFLSHLIRQWFGGRIMHRVIEWHVTMSPDNSAAATAVVSRPSPSQCQWPGHHTTLVPLLRSLYVFHTLKA